MKNRSAAAAFLLVLATGLSGCIWMPAMSDDSAVSDPDRLEQDRPEQQIEADGAEERGAQEHQAVLEPPMSPDQLAPLLEDAYGGLFERMVQWRRGDAAIEDALEFATITLVESQVRVFGTSIPDEYTVDGYYEVIGVSVDDAWESGPAVTAHVCVDDSDVRLLDENDRPVPREPGNTLIRSTVLFELSEDGARFLVADIFSIFPDVEDPCPPK